MPDMGIQGVTGRNRRAHGLGCGGHRILGWIQGFRLYAFEHYLAPKVAKRIPNILHTFKIQVGEHVVASKISDPKIYSNI